MGHSSDPSDPFLRLLKDTILARTSLADVGRRLSPSGNSGWLSLGLLGKRKLSIPRIRQILDAIGVGEGEFFQEYASQVSPIDVEIRAARPQDLLRRARGGQGVRSDLLARVTEQSIQPIREGALYSVPERSREIDAIRESSRDTANFHAEIWVLGLLRDATTGSGLVEAKVAELASALGVWGSLQRLLGRAVASARALEIALDLHGINHWSPAYADLLERAGMTLRELGAIEDGLGLVRDAAALFRVHGDSWSESKALLMLGVLAYHSGKPSVAKVAYERCIEAGADDRRRSSAIIGLAAVANEEGQFDESEAYLREARSIEGLPPRIELQIRWQSALLAVRRGQHESAADDLESLLQEALDHCEPIDLFLLFFDLAEVLAYMGAQSRFNRVTAIMTQFVPLLEKHALASAVLGQFFTEVLSHPLQDLAIERTRQAFEAAFNKANQPPGSGTPPIS